MGIFPKNKDLELQNPGKDVSDSLMDIDLIIPVYIQAMKKLEFEKVFNEMKISTLDKVVCDLKNFNLQILKIIKILKSKIYKYLWINISQIK